MKAVLSHRARLIHALFQYWLNADMSVFVRMLVDGCREQHYRKKIYLRFEVEFSVSRSVLYFLIAFSKHSNIDTVIGLNSPVAVGP